VYGCSAGGVCKLMLLLLLAAGACDAWSGNDVINRDGRVSSRAASSVPVAFLMMRHSTTFRQ